MIKPADKRVVGTALKHRQQEVEQHLARFGLRPGPRRLTPGGASSEANRIRKLRKAFESLGPVFIAFGRYLSTRVDLFSARDCLELASLPNRTECSSPTAVRYLIRQELGSLPEDVFRVFEQIPFVSGLFVQEHRAWLTDQEAITVKLVHPEVEGLLHCDAQLLQSLAGLFVGNDCNRTQIESAIEDFVISLQQQTNFSLPARAAKDLSKDAELFGMLKAPFLYDELSSNRILTVERLPGLSIEDLLNSLPSPKDHVIESAAAEECYGVAHRLCVVWLRQAFLGTQYPVEPSPENISLQPNDQFAFTDGGWARLPKDARANLWDYLIAVVTENPDAACSSLLKELAPGKEPTSEEHLGQRFRQLVPFRDSDWAYSTDNNNLAEYLFLHWKLASQDGYCPRRHVPSFYRGLFVLATVAQRLAPHRDALRDAVQSVRVLAAAERFRDLLSTPRLGQQMDDYFSIMLDLPQRLDGALTMGADGKARMRLQRSETVAARRKKNSSTIDVALLLAFGAMIILPQRFEANLAGSRWFAAGVVMFICLGSWLLRSSRRR